MPSAILESQELRRKLDQYLDLLLRKNEEVNLTALRDWELGFWKHLVDSLAVWQVEPLGSTVDWGSGGGLPGIPLALAREAMGSAEPVHFLDSVGKKLKATEEFGRALGLQGSHYWNGRGEDLLRAGQLAGVEAVVMRAVAPAERAVTWLDARIPRWIFLLGPQQLDLWRAEKKKIGTKGLAFGRELAYELPRGHGSRVILELVRR